MADETVPNLRDEMAKVIRETVPLHNGGYRTADAALAVVQSELDVKDKEIARWKRLAEAQQKTMKELAKSLVVQDEQIVALLGAQEAMLNHWAESASPGAGRVSDRQQELWRALHEAADRLREARGAG